MDILIVLYVLKENRLEKVFKVIIIEIRIKYITFMNI